MKHISLGGLDVSRIGLGTMAMSGYYLDPTSNDAESIRTIQRALDLGVTHIDTAEIYGPFHSEEIVGRAIKGRRDQVVIATKFGLVSHSDGGPGVLDSGPTPDPAGPVELERHAAPRPHILFDCKMRVLHQPLRSRQPGAAAIAPFDPGLHEGCTRCRQKSRHRSSKPIGGRHKIRIEDGDIGRVAKSHAGSQRAGFEAAAIATTNVVRVYPISPQSRDCMLGDIRREIGAVVQYLDLQTVMGPVKSTGRPDRTLDHHRLVIDGDLDQHTRQFVRQLWCCRFSTR